MLGEGSRKRHLPEHEEGISARPVQPVRRRALPEHLPDEGAFPAQGRHRGPRPGLVHRVQVLHRGVSLRSALHRSQHDDGGEMQLLREPPRSELGARLRGGLPHAVPRVRRHGRRGFEDIETHHAAPLPREKARIQHGAQHLLSRGQPPTPGPHRGGPVRHLQAGRDGHGARRRRARVGKQARREPHRLRHLPRGSLGDENHHLSADQRREHGSSGHQPVPVDVRL